jgi:hypothetical protein
MWLALKYTEEETGGRAVDQQDDVGVINVDFHKSICQNTH